MPGHNDGNDGTRFPNYFKNGQGGASGNGKGAGKSQNEYNKYIEGKMPGGVIKASGGKGVDPEKHNSSHMGSNRNS